MSRIETVFLFDLDGTLVDSVYQHVLAWKEALDQEGINLSVWRIHRRIGMSGGLFMNQLLRETGLEISPERLQRLPRRGWALRSKPPSSSATRSGTCWPPGVAAALVLVCSPAATARKSWSGR